YKLALVGGDTTQGPLSITVTVHGFVPEGAALLRGGARVGDAVYVTGTLGDAAAGLRLIDQPTFADTATLALVERLNRPTPRDRSCAARRSRARRLRCDAHRPHRRRVRRARPRRRRQGRYITASGLGTLRVTLGADQRRALLAHPAGWIACGFGSGLIPVAPG